MLAAFLCPLYWYMTDLKFPFDSYYKMILCSTIVHTDCLLYGTLLNCLLAYTNVISDSFQLLSMSHCRASTNKIPPTYQQKPSTKIQHVKKNSRITQKSKMSKRTSKKRIQIKQKMSKTKRRFQVKGWPTSIPAIPTSLPPELFEVRMMMFDKKHHLWVENL